MNLPRDDADSRRGGVKLRRGFVILGVVRSLADNLQTHFEDDVFSEWRMIQREEGLFADEARE